MRVSGIVIFWVSGRKFFKFYNYNVQCLELVPRENQLFVDDTLELNCTTTQQDGTINMSASYFSHYAAKLKSNEQNKIKQLNDYTVRLRRRKIQLESRGRYYCSNGESTCVSTVDVKRKLLFTILHIYQFSNCLDRNKKSVNFKCMFWFTDRLNCTWSKPNNTYLTAYDLMEIRE